MHVKSSVAYMLRNNLFTRVRQRLAQLPAVFAASGILITGLGPAARAGALTAGDGRQIVVRGVGWSPWYPDSGWSRPKEVQEKEIRLLRNAHINTLRVWGTMRPADASTWRKRGFYVITQVPNGWWKNQPVPPTRYADGKVHRFPPFTHPATAKAFAQACASAGRLQRSVPNLAAMLLGNEFSWVGRNSKNQYVYAGFDPYTLKAFRAYLVKRFGTIDRLNRLCRGRFRNFEEIRPPGEFQLRYEWWSFLEQAFERCMQNGYEALKKELPDVAVGYAKLMGRWDPCSEDAPLSFLDFGGQNLYWHWDKDWTAFFLHYKELVRHAAGKPILITETGFRSGLTPEQETRAALQLRKELWLLFLQPATAGVCVFTFNDEWWRDGNSTKRSANETWGIVNAWREPKPAYLSVRDVYAGVQRLEPILSGMRPSLPTRVAVTCQNLDWAAAPGSGNRVREVVRFLAARGIDFDLSYGRDLAKLPAGPWTHVIVCDAVLPGTPDGKQPAVRGLVSFLRNGGRVLMLSPKPFRTLYGEAAISGVLRRTAFTLGPGMRRSLKVGSGVIHFRPLQDLKEAEAPDVLAPFLEEVNPDRIFLDSPRVRPETARSGVWFFCRTGRAGGKVLGVVNTTDSPVESIRVTLTREWANGLAPVDNDASSVDIRDGVLRITNLSTVCVLAAGLPASAGAGH